MGALKWLSREAQESILHIPVALALYICPTKKRESALWVGKWSFRKAGTFL